MASSTDKNRPFDDILSLIQTMPLLSDGEFSRIQSTIDEKTGPLSPLGRLNTELTLVAAWQGQAQPSLMRPLISVFAGTHGVAKSVFEGDIIEQAKARVATLTEGSSAVRGIATDLGSAFKVYEFGLEHPSTDFTEDASLNEKDCAAAIAFGMEVVAEGADVIVLGNAGFGAATAAAAIARSLYGGTADYWAGGLEATAEKRIAAIEKGTQRHIQDGKYSSLEALRCFGGRDLAGCVGAILAARHQRIPVILDGFVVCAAAAVLHTINPATLDHCIAAHVSAEPAHAALLDRLGKRPVMDLGVNIGDGSGGALLISLLKSASAGLKTL